jgi:hypothetical protein
VFNTTADCPSTNSKWHFLHAFALGKFAHLHEVQYLMSLKPHPLQHSDVIGFFVLQTGQTVCTFVLQKLHLKRLSAISFLHLLQRI